MRFSEVKEKEVINVCDCRKLGNVCDAQIDVCKGVILKLFIPVPGKWGGICAPEYEYEICFDQIVQIGPDIILVKVNLEEVKRPCGKRREKKRLEFDKW